MYCKQHVFLKTSLSGVWTSKLCIFQHVFFKDIFEGCFDIKTLCKIHSQHGQVRHIDKMIVLTKKNKMKNFDTRKRTAPIKIALRMHPPFNRKVYVQQQFIYACLNYDDYTVTNI